MRLFYGTVTVRNDTEYLRFSLDSLVVENSISANVKINN